MFYSAIVNNVLRHCHSWLARQYFDGFYRKGSSKKSTLQEFMSIHEIRLHAYYKQEIPFKKDICLLQFEEPQYKDTVSLVYNWNTEGVPRIFCMCWMI